ncbi:MAG: endonuclease/exonuclease/phosphatase family protein [Chloroflexota bacterium]
MSQPLNNPEVHWRRTVLVFGLFFLFFFQLLSDFVAGIYAFGLLGTGIPNEIVSVLFLFSPLALLFFKHRVSNRWLIGFAGMGLVCRFVEVLLDTRGRMLVSGLGVGALLLFFTGIYSLRGQAHPRISRQLSMGLALALLLSILFRTLNAGWDISTYGIFRLLGWVLVLLAAYLLKDWSLTAQPDDQTGRPAGTGRLIGYALGVSSVWLLLYFVFSSPNVVARWTGVPHLPVLTVLLLAWIGYFWWWQRSGPPSRGILIVWGVVFTLSLLFTILPHQVVFSASPQGYPLLEPGIAWWQVIPVYLMLITSPVLLAAFQTFSEEIFTLQPTSRQLGAAFSIASLYILLMIFGQVFTTVYDYIPVVGPFFRDKFWLVHLILGLGVTLPLLLVRVKAQEKHTPDNFIQWSMVILAAGALVSLALLSPRPRPPMGTASTLRVLTYNIQQGYDAEGQLNFDGQLAYIRSTFPDIVGLQESDTNRIAGGNADLVEYFARELKMYSYYGPKVVPGTFGIALLSRYPIEEARTFFVYSEGEQVAVIEAKITVGDQTFTIYVNHLGNGGPLVQAEQFLELTEGQQHVIAMGDYNFRPYEEQYARAVAGLEDVFEITLQAEVPVEFDFTERIDHIFVSPGMQVNLAQYLIRPESDHPALLVELGW